jgi:putative restriction endonuclease
MPAFLLTWKETGWPHENIVRLVATLDAQGHVDEPWRIVAHNLAKPGDRVWVLKQGRGPRGIFGAGVIIGPSVRGEAGNGKVQWMVPVRFEALVDPKQSLLIGEDAVARILTPVQLRAQASGYPLKDEQSAAFEALLVTKPSVELGGTGEWTQAELQAIVGGAYEG